MWTCAHQKELLLGQECHVARGKDIQLELLALWAPGCEPPLTVAVGEVEVALGTGLAVLPGEVGFAVAAPSEVLAGAVGEVRLTVTACREGQASSSVTECPQQENLSVQPSRAPSPAGRRCRGVHTHGSKRKESRWGGQGIDSTQGCTSHN